MNATKIAWFSRHQPTIRQREALAQLFGASVEIQVDARAFYSSAQVANRFAKTRANELVIVAPLNIIRALTLQGIYPIVAVMERCSGRHPEAEVHTHHLHYRFTHFERIDSVETKGEKLCPSSPTAPNSPTATSA